MLPTVGRYRDGKILPPPEDVSGPVGDNGYAPGGQRPAQPGPTRCATSNAARLRSPRRTHIVMLGWSSLFADVVYDRGPVTDEPPVTGHLGSGATSGISKKAPLH